MTDLINLPFGSAGLIALLGYAVVFMGLIMLMLVIMLTAALMKRSAPKAAAPVEDGAQIAPSVPVSPAPGTAGELKLYDTDPRDAAMVMAIVADTLNKPLNELRFISVREVK